MAVDLTAGLQLLSDLKDAEILTVDSAPSPGFTVKQVKAYNGILVTPYATIATGKIGTLIVKAEDIKVECESGTYTQGEKVYFKSSNGKITTTSSGATRCGYVAKTEASSVTEVRISFDGTLV